MPRRNALVDYVTRVSRPDSRSGLPLYLEVSFGGGRSGLLDTSYRGRVWAEVLESLRESGSPAYVEIDPETNQITQLLQPILYNVARVTTVKEGMLVDLAISHARHILRRDHAEFKDLSKSLSAAQKASTQVYVVENDAHEIIDVRPAPKSDTPSTKTKGGR
jgi:hypothetical protein